mgnify:FL=1
MIKGGKLLALITARGGSKRLPKKNILKLADKPLIAWTIEASLKSPYIDEVIVSTDDVEIAEISRSYGADVPFIRPPELATENASSIDVLKHAVLTLKNLDRHFDYLILLQPTSPLRKATHINEAIQMYVDKKAKVVISVCEVSHPIEWAGLLPDDLSMDDFFSQELQGKRVQDLPQRYRLNGAIYIINIHEFLKHNSIMLKEGSYGFIMGREDSVDIDNHIDFKFAEFLIHNNRN